MHMRITILAIICAACRLDPLVEDDPGISVNILPAGSEVPSVAINPELLNQIKLNDGIEDRNLFIPRGRGQSGPQGTPANLAEVRYWAFGSARTAPSPLFLFVNANGQPIPGHPPLVESLPGDPGYNPLHNLHHVVVTDKYNGELFTTSAALADGVEIGLLETPEPIGQFVNGPIVLPDMTAEVGGMVDPTATVAPEPVFGRGFRLAMFRFGGDKGVQPGGALLPTDQVSFLRGVNEANFDTARPIFQATIPSEIPSGTTANYTPLSVVVNVDLTTDRSQIVLDSDLFIRNAAGAITATTSNVDSFTVTTTTLVFQLQFEDGKL